LGIRNVKVLNLNPVNSDTGIGANYAAIGTTNAFFGFFHIGIVITAAVNFSV
jgi:hypothetical protein